MQFNLPDQFNPGSLIFAPKQLQRKKANWQYRKVLTRFLIEGMAPQEMLQSIHSSPMEAPAVEEDLEKQRLFCDTVREAIVSGGVARRRVECE